jgi:hypothetical protein
MNADLSNVIAGLRRGDWATVHAIVQQDESSPLSCWAHGIVHMLEGDFDNARYWYRRAGRRYRGDDAAAGEIDALEKAWKEESA